MKQLALLEKIYGGDVEVALAETKEACFNALDAFGKLDRHSAEDLSDACSIVRSGDPELCFYLLEILLRLSSETPLGAIRMERIGALVDVLGRLPRGTLTSTQRSRLVAFCVQQVKDLSQEVTTGDVDALVTLRLVPAVLAAFDSESDGAAFAASDDDEGEDEKAAPAAAGQLDYEKTVRELEALLRRFERCGWWRAEAAASIARQALAAARSSYNPLQDAFVRAKAAGRIVQKLYRASKIVMEGIGSFGVLTLIDLAVNFKDMLTTEGLAADVKELWADLGRMVGAGSPQGKKCWYRPARLLTALAERGHAEELQASLEAIGGAVVVVAQPKLAAALAAALVLAVEATGGDSEAALASVKVAGVLIDAAHAAAVSEEKTRSREVAIKSAVAAAQALASIAASECGGAAAEMAAERLRSLALKEDRVAREATAAAARLLGLQNSDLAAPVFRQKRALRQSPCMRVQPSTSKGPSKLLRAALARLVAEPEEAALRKALHAYAGKELNKLSGDLRDAVELYVPPKTTTDPARRCVVDLLSHTIAFLARALPAAAEALPDPTTGTAPARALLIAGEPGSSKSTFLAFLHRRACEQWRRTHGRPPRAKALRVSEDALEDIQTSRGLVLLLDAYDELDCRGGPPPRLWPENDLADWASGVIVTCRSALLAVRDDYVELFAPRGKKSSLEQVKEYFEQFTRLYGPGASAETRDACCDWTAEEYLSQVRRIPGTLSLTENPFTLNMVARTLPKIVRARVNVDGAGVLLTIRELYDAFVEEWFDRQWDRVRDKGKEYGVDISQWRKKDFSQFGRSFCKDLAAAMFSASVSEFACPLPEVAMRKPRFASAPDANSKDEREPRGGSDPLQACIDLFQSQDSPMEVFIREQCPLLPLRPSGEQEDGATRAVHVRFLHKTLLEYFVAEEMFERAIARNALAAGSLRRSRRASLWSAAGTGLIHRFLLTGEPKILEFLSECCSSDEFYRFTLLGLVEKSRGPQAARSDCIASANAMTILNRAGYSFAGSCLRGVRMPGADLQRLEAAGADLRGADLTDCGLQEANLGGADLRGAKLDGASSL
eukprot:tig00001038_g6538.t1